MKACCVSAAAKGRGRGARVDLLRAAAALLLLAGATGRTAGEHRGDSVAEDHAGESFPSSASEAEQCSRLRNEAPEDTNSGFPTFVAARPSVVLDLSHCVTMPAAPRINLAARRHGARANAVFTQGGWDASAVIDGISSEPDNGWAYIGLLEQAWLTIHLAPSSDGESCGRRTEDDAVSTAAHDQGLGEISAAGALAARVVIISGSGRLDHHVSAFRLWVLTRDGPSVTRCSDDAASGEGDSSEAAWREIPGLSSRHPDVAVAADGVSVVVKAGVGEVVLDFPPLAISALRLKVDSSDAASNKNAIINEIEVLTSDGLSHNTMVAEMAVYVDDIPIGAPRHLPLPSPTGATMHSSIANPFVHRIWLPNESGVHEVRLELGGAIAELHVTIYEKLSVGLKTHIAFPPKSYTFGRAMLPFIRVGAEGYQCLGGQPLDNSTGGCWAQPFDTYFITLEIHPIEGTGIDLVCQLWGDSEDQRHCTQVCGVVNRAKGTGHGNGEMHRCCDFGNYAELMRSGRYIGLSCLPEGEFRLTVRFYDYYKVYTERHQVMITVDRTDMGLWYHRGAAEASYLDAVQAAISIRRSAGERAHGSRGCEPSLSKTADGAGSHAHGAGPESLGRAAERAASAGGRCTRGCAGEDDFRGREEGCEHWERRDDSVWQVAENVTEALDALVYSCTCEPVDYLEGGGERWRFREDGRGGHGQAEQWQCCGIVRALLDGSARYGRARCTGPHARTWSACLLTTGRTVPTPFSPAPAPSPLAFHPDGTDGSRANGTARWRNILVSTGEKL